MTDFEAAEQHLSAALERLQAALARRGPGGEPIPRVGGELPEDVVALQEECQSLREVADHVAQRIDGSVGEIDRLLGS